MSIKLHTEMNVFQIYVILTLLLIVESDKLYLQMPGALPDHTDSYICTLFPLNDFASSKGFVTKFTPIANRSSVHHMILRSCNKWLNIDKPLAPHPCGPEDECNIIFSWAHDGKSFELPNGVSFEIGKDSTTKSLHLEVHYSKKLIEPDFATIELTFTRTPTPQRAGLYVLASNNGEIPGRMEYWNVDVSCRFLLDEPIEIFAMRMHAHDLAISVSTFLLDPAQGQLHLIGRGSPQWPQTFYNLSQLGSLGDVMEVRRDDLLLVRCVYNSSNRARRTLMGSTHSDEMCNAYLMYYIDADYFIPSGSDSCLDDNVPEGWKFVPHDTIYYTPDTMPPEPVKHISFEMDSEWKVDANLGELSGIAMSSLNNHSQDIFILHRGENHWRSSSFDENFLYQEDPLKFVTSPILQIDAASGRVVSAFGDRLLILPHGIAVESSADAQPRALWVTDVALHVVMKFDWGKWLQPSLTLGKPMIPGDDGDHFCQPADVAIASTGEIFVADGYCNRRIVKFSPEGEYLMSWGLQSVNGLALRDAFSVVHSITIIPPRKLNSAHDKSLEQVCAADRENARIACYNLFGGLIAIYSGQEIEPMTFAITYSPVHSVIFGITGAEDPATFIYSSRRDVDTGARLMNPSKVFMLKPSEPIYGNDDKLLLPQHIDNAAKVVHIHGDRDLLSPHAIAVNANGSAMFILELYHSRVARINMNISEG